MRNVADRRVHGTTDEPTIVGFERDEAVATGCRSAPALRSPGGIRGAAGATACASPPISLARCAALWRALGKRSGAATKPHLGGGDQVRPLHIGHKTPPYWSQRWRAEGANCTTISIAYRRAQHASQRPSIYI